jgi:tripartite-type tricarboxylate transporter receptor subunit TctC
MPPAVPQVKGGKLRAIAVTSAQRSPVLPDVPTMSEQGMKDFDDLTWFGFFAPAGTPPDVVNRLNAEIMRALGQPDAREKLTSLGFDVRPNTAAEFAAFVRSEVPKWTQAVRDSGAKAD